MQVSHPTQFKYTGNLTQEHGLKGTRVNDRSMAHLPTHLYHWHLYSLESGISCCCVDSRNQTSGYLYGAIHLFSAHIYGQHLHPCVPLYNSETT